MNIYEAINKSISEIPAIGKDSKNIQQGWTFRSIDAIIDNTRKIIAANGICIFPETIEKEIKVDVIEKNYKGEISTKRLTTANVKVKYKLVSKFDGTFETSITSGESQDFSDKAVGQAETFAFKSMLSKVFFLGFEDDPDHDTIDTTNQKVETKSQPKQTLPKVEQPKKSDNTNKPVSLETTINAWYAKYTSIKEEKMSERVSSVITDILKSDLDKSKSLLALSVLWESKKSGMAQRKLIPQYDLGIKLIKEAEAKLNQSTMKTFTDVTNPFQGDK